MRPLRPRVRPDPLALWVRLDRQDRQDRWLRLGHLTPWLRLDRLGPWLRPALPGLWRLLPRSGRQGR